MEASVLRIVLFEILLLVLPRGVQALDKQRLIASQICNRMLFHIILGQHRQQHINFTVTASRHQFNSTSHGLLTLKSGTLCTQHQGQTDLEKIHPYRRQIKFSFVILTSPPVRVPLE